MNVTKQGEGQVAVLKVQVSQADYSEKVATILKDYRKKASIKGFRPGTVPMTMVKQMYGKYATVDEVNKVVSQALQDYFKENKLHVLGEPLPNEKEQKEVNWDTDTDFEFAFDVAFAPEINIELSKKNKADYYKIIIDDEMINSRIEGFAGRFGSQEDADDIEGTEFLAGALKQVNGEQTNDKVSLLLTKVTDEKELAKFKGAKKNDKIVFNPKKAFGNDTDVATLVGTDKENTALMEADYEFTVDTIKRFKKAEVNQELFDKVYGKDAVVGEEAFRARIKEEYENNFVMNSDFKFLADFKKKLVESNKFDLPEEFLKRWLLEANKDNEKVTPEQIEHDFPLFMEDLRWQLISGKFVKDNNIEVSADDVKNSAKEYTRFQLAQYGMVNAEDKLVEQWSAEILKNREEVNRLYEMEENKKLIAFFKETVKLNEVEVSLDKFNEMSQEK